MDSSSEPKIDSDFWAISCYFNPAGYQRRLQNYHTFRNNLKIPLITVELSFDGHYDLDQNAADILVQLTTTSVMWQKERLLNLALDQLPRNCTHFAWLDCDVTFEEDDWVTNCRQALTHFPVIQPFSEVLEPPPDSNTFNLKESTRCGTSLAYLLQEKSVSEDLLTGNMRVDHNCNSGLAWAARREVFEEIGFYDACIVGSGNRAMLCAALGQPGNAKKSIRMTDAWADHYYPWAAKHYEQVEGRIGYIPGTLIHLWHGDLKNRRYQSRHEDFSTFNFDPVNDITLDDSLAWRWNSHKPKMHDFANRYFKSRKEDSVFDDTA